MDATPLLFTITPADFFWQWPWAFVMTYPERLVESGRVAEAWSRQVQ